MEKWIYILDNDASFGHYHLCPVCGQQSPTSSRICPQHEIYYVVRGTSPDMYFERPQRIPHIKALGEVG